MIASIVSAMASVLGWFAAKGIDDIVGKWLAYFTIVWEQQASDRAKAAFDVTMRALKSQDAEKAKAWDDWRNRATLSGGPGNGTEPTP